RGFTALHFAAREGDIDITKQLLEAGVDVNIRSQVVMVDEKQRTREYAAGAGVAGGMSEESAGSTPLVVATVRGHVPLALFLLEHGADPNVADAGYTPLHWASGLWESGVANPVYGFDDPMGGIPDRQAKLRLVKSLLAHGARPNARVTRRLPG